MERWEGDVWIGLRLVGKINLGYFRETRLFLPPHGLYQLFEFFINYFIQKRLGLDLISFGSKFSNISCYGPIT